MTLDTYRLDGRKRSSRCKWLWKISETGRQLKATKLVTMYKGRRWRVLSDT